MMWVLGQHCTDDRPPLERGIQEQGTTRQIYQFSFKKLCLVCSSELYKVSLSADKTTVCIKVDTRFFELNFTPQRAPENWHG